MSSCTDAVRGISADCTQRLRRGTNGQATVEAAFLIPLIFLGLLLLLQPGILLYDRVVMESAASDACRMLVTRTASQGLSDKVYEEAVIRHLGAIPPQENFHVHEGGCSWEIQLQGNESSQTVSATISQQVKPLPLLDAGCKLIGLANASGNLEVSVTRTMQTQPEWVAASKYGLHAGAWAGNWG
jgi:Flp pilus assembly protein TadG